MDQPIRLGNFHRLVVQCIYWLQESTCKLTHRRNHVNILKNVPSLSQLRHDSVGEGGILQDQGNAGIIININSTHWNSEQWILSVNSTNNNWRLKGQLYSQGHNWLRGQGYLGGVDISSWYRCNYTTINGWLDLVKCCATGWQLKRGSKANIDNWAFPICRGYARRKLNNINCII